MFNTTNHTITYNVKALVQAVDYLHFPTLPLCDGETSSGVDDNEVSLMLIETIVII